MAEEKAKEIEEKEEEKKEEKPQVKKEEKPEEKEEAPSVPTEAVAEKKVVEEKKEEKVKKEVKKEEKPKKEVKVPKKFKQLVKEIEDLKVLDLAELVKILEEKLGVSAVSQVVAAPAGIAAAPEAKAPEKQIFTIELKATGEKKIEVIKAVRDIVSKGLKEAKDLVDAVAKGPQILKENVKKEEAEEIKKKLEAAGATVELK